MDGDGVDFCDDCDDNNPNITFYTWYLDTDEDGFGTRSSATVQCDPPRADWVLDAATTVSRRICQDPQNTTDHQKLKELYRHILSRNPTGLEIELALNWLANSTDEGNAEVRWSTFTQNLLIGNEFFFVR